MAPPGFSSTVRRLFDNAIGALSPDDGISDTELDHAENQLGLRIPLPLREYYRLTGNHEVNRAFNRHYAPNDIESRDGMGIFCEENQRVVYWAFKLSDSTLDDPNVWQLNPDEGKWYFECKRMSSYLVKSLCWQAVCGGLAGCASGKIRSDDFRWIEATFERVECVETDTEYDLHAFENDGVIVCTFPTMDGCPTYAGSNAESTLDLLADRLGLDML